MLTLLLCLALAQSPADSVARASAGELGAQAPLCEPVSVDRQILWQRSLEDARAISRREGRPILVAVNMDGESASERIVRERYRDPRFVALTRRFVCVTASAFRHGERDHATDGARVASPRLGEVTSGEAIRLEPILFDAYLGGERIAPRHALILPDGTKAFDLFQLFDLRDLDAALQSAQALAPPPSTPDERPLDPATMDFADWLDCAGAVEHRARLRFEALLRAPAPVEQAAMGLRALLERGGPGSIDALRIAFARCGEAPGQLASLATLVLRARGLEREGAAVLRELLTDIDESAWQPGLGARAELLDALAAVVGDDAALRSLLSSYGACGDGADERARARRWGFGVGIEAADFDGDLGPSDPARVLAAAARLPRGTPWRLDDTLSDEATREQELLDADAASAAAPDDLDARLRFAKAALIAARGRIETSGSSIDLLLGDADAAFRAVLASRPGDAATWLLLARTAYLRSDFAAEADAAWGAWSALPTFDRARLARLLDGTPSEADARALQEPRERQEALRWIADAAARRIEAMSGKDAAEEARNLSRGLAAAALAALAPDATPTDWLTLSAFHAALGRREDEWLAARQGLAFFPEAQELRDAFYRALWDRGRSRIAREESERLARENPQSAVAVWFVGYAAMQEADTCRRAEDPRAAIAAYTLAASAFESCASRAPGYADSCDFYRARAALGRGFAHLLVDERAAAAEALVEGIRIRPAIAEVRDPLDREAVDLLDAALEWRERGPSPVDPIELSRALLATDPGNAAWARRVADTELREGLRADGRSEPALGDRHLERSIEVARMAVELQADDAARRTLAQSLCVDAERRIARADFGRAAGLLSAAAPLMGEAALPDDATDAQWIELAARMRSQLGDARPVVRPGR